MKFVPLVADHEHDVLELLRDAGLGGQFDTLGHPDQIGRAVRDPYFLAEASWLALAEGHPAGFCLAVAFPQLHGEEVGVLRLGVAERFRRRGLGSALLERACAAFKGRPGCSAVSLFAWLPAPDAESFAAHHGFRAARMEWRMARPVVPVPKVRWPDGIRTRPIDGSEQAIRDWIDAYNESFADLWRVVPGTIDSGRAIVRDPLFLADGLLLAYRHDRCVGFCRNEAMGARGVVSVLGTTRDARGIGLGRALLRWAVAYFAGRGIPNVWLNVDGENETALRLYRSEGFAIERRRRIWERDVGSW